jgi:hypothetical protein
MGYNNGPVYQFENQQWINILPAEEIEVSECTPLTRERLADTAASLHAPSLDAIETVLRLLESSAIMAMMHDHRGEVLPTDFNTHILDKVSVSVKELRIMLRDGLSDDHKLTVNRYLKDGTR